MTLPCPLCNIKLNPYNCTTCSLCNIDLHWDLNHKIKSIFYKFNDYEMDIYIHQNTTYIYKINANISFSLIKKFDYAFPLAPKDVMLNKIKTIIAFL